MRTKVDSSGGEVLRGSSIGALPFCAGGSVRHEPGSPEIGFPAINAFRCDDGSLRIGFGPGPDQMNEVVQTSAWEILEGSGSFAGMTGAGEMSVRWNRVGGSRARETFRGHVVRP